MPPDARRFDMDVTSVPAIMQMKAMKLPHKVTMEMRIIVWYSMQRWCMFEVKPAW